MENMLTVRLTDDQYFLLCLIMGAYFGPDLKEGKPCKSALRRLAEDIPQYNANELSGSRMKIMVIQSVYYYVLIKAEESVVVKQPLLLQYLQGNLLIPAEISSAYPQFDDLFPAKLHARSQFNNQHTVDSIVFINNPEFDYIIDLRDIERFKRLTGLEEDFVLDRESAMLYVFEDNKILYDFKGQETSTLDDDDDDDDTLQHVNLQCVNYVPCIETHRDDLTKPSNSTATSQTTASFEADLDQGMIFLPSCPSKEEWSDLVHGIKCGSALTGNAARGHVGPVLGLIDIGESEDSYLFRVSLPGVKRDERDFSCEVDSDGTVIIKGVTVTGGKKVEKFSLEFVMQSQKMCPPGPFSISFKLPGPVDPQQFHGTFATDGILEGIAYKAMS